MDNLIKYLMEFVLTEGGRRRRHRRQLQAARLNKAKAKVALWTPFEA
jgi:hypothetical protein